MNPWWHGLALYGGQGGGPMHLKSIVMVLAEVVCIVLANLEVWVTLTYSDVLFYLLCYLFSYFTKALSKQFIHCCFLFFRTDPSFGLVGLSFSQSTCQVVIGGAFWQAWSLDKGSYIFCLIWVFGPVLAYHQQKIFELWELQSTPEFSRVLQSSQSSKIFCWWLVATLLYFGLGHGLWEAAERQVLSEGNDTTLFSFFVEISSINRALCVLWMHGLSLWIDCIFA